jgi:hypothetical protein
MLGHKNLKSTRIYAKVVQIKVSADMEACVRTTVGPAGGNATGRGAQPARQGDFERHVHGKSARGHLFRQPEIGGSIKTNLCPTAASLSPAQEGLAFCPQRARQSKPLPAGSVSASGSSFGQINNPNLLGKVVRSAPKNETELGVDFEKK